MVVVYKGTVLFPFHFKQVNPFALVSIYISFIFSLLLCITIEHLLKCELQCHQVLNTIPNLFIVVYIIVEQKSTYSSLCFRVTRF